MAQDKEIVFKVKADTSQASGAVTSFSDNISKSNRDVQSTFDDLRSRIKEATAEVNQMSKSYGENSKQADEQRKILAQLNIEYDQLTQNNTDLSATFEDVYGDVMDVNKAVGELEDRMYMLYVTGQQNTQEFQDLQAQVVEYRKAVISVDKAVDQLAEKGQVLGTALQIGSTVVAGYGAAQATMAIFGEESEALVQTLTKLQAVQTLLVSIEQIKLSLDKQSLIMIKGRAVATAVLTKAQTAYTMATTATTVATRLLGVAMLALPIIAIIAGITALVSWMGKTKDATEEATEANKRYGDSLRANAEQASKHYSQMQKSDDAYFQNKIELLKSQGKSELEIMHWQEAQLDRQQIYRDQEIAMLEKTLEEQGKVRQNFWKNKKFSEAVEFDKEIETTNDRLLDLRLAEEKYYNDSEILRNNYNSKIKENEEKAQADRLAKQKEYAAKRLEEAEKARQLELDRSRYLEDLITLNIEDEYVRRLATMELNQEREQKALIEKYGQDTELLKQLATKQENEINELITQIQKEAFEKEQEIRNEQREKEQEQIYRDLESQKAATEAKLIRLEEDFYAELELKQELADIELSQALMNEDLTEGEKLKIYAEYDAKRADIDKQRVAREKENAQAVKKAIVTTYEMSMTAIQSLSDAFFDGRIAKAKKGSDEELRLEKKKFEVNKKLQIAQAIIQGIQGVQAAYASGSAIPVVGAVTGPAFAALAAITALANVNKIKNQQFEAPSAGSIEAPSVTAPTIPTVEDVFQEETGSTLTDVENPQQQVVILQSDIENAQNESDTTKAISGWG